MQSNVRGVVSSSLLHAKVRLCLDVGLVGAFLGVAVNGPRCLATDSLPSKAAQKIVMIRQERHSLSGRHHRGLASRSCGLAPCSSLCTSSLSRSSSLLGNRLRAAERSVCRCHTVHVEDTHAFPPVLAATRVRVVRPAMGIDGGVEKWRGKVKDAEKSVGEDSR